MRIDSSGNVGIGETSPLGKLHVKTADSGASATVHGDELIVEGSGNSGMSILSGNSSSGTIYFGDSDDNNVGEIQYSHSNNHLAFNVNASERMRITSSGDVGILNSSPSSYGNATELVVGNHSIDDAGITIATTTGSSGRFQFADNTSSPFVGAMEYSHNNDAMTFYTAGSGRMVIGSTGSLNVQGVYDQTTVNGANVNVASDGHIRRSSSSLRYKNTVNDATYGLTELLTLRPVTYKGNNDGDTIFGGLIAEEVHDAGLTEFVQYDDDNKPDALAYGNMVSLCIKAIQELKAENTALANRITTLEGA
jgi:hypothetical protein